MIIQKLFDKNTFNQKSLYNLSSKYIIRLKFNN